MQINLEKKPFWLPLIIVCLAQIGTSGDNSVVSLSTQQFITHLGASMDQVQLANIVYSLLTGALMVFGGMLGIAKGFKKIFLLGALFCFFGELIVVFAPDIFVITWVGRLIMGFGAAFMVPSVLGIISSSFDGTKKVLAFGAVGSATGIAVIIMPLSAGMIMDTLGYKAAFVALSIWFLIVFVGAIIFIPSIKPNTMKVDYWGTIFTAIGLVCFILGFSKISVWGLIEPLDAPFEVFGIAPSIPLIILGLVILALNLFYEKSFEQKNGVALIPQSFLKTRQVRNGLYVTGLIFLIFGAGFFLITSWIMVVSEGTSTDSAIAIVFMAVPMIVFSFLLPKKFAYLSPKMVCMVSSVFSLLSCIGLFFAFEEGGYNRGLTYFSLVLLGIGMGGFSSQSVMIVASALNPADAAQSGGIQASTRNIWQAAGVAIVGAVFLFGLSATFKTSLLQAPISSTIKEYFESQKVIPLVSLKTIKDKLSTYNFDADETNKILEIYKQDTLKAGRYALIALLILILLHIPGFMGLPTKGWVEKPKKGA
ncbi:MFS transporter [Helicobacter sp. 13S00477-4]|uniref:MFS transporter n=1 Tax=Helicobacter sp. 13S00477-4 TaxID=1905759 RepID=UPI000BA593CF|nr:MFS transporter [Helicobacter sp. 13S00477-4]PAF52241.1 MFS transporter [Helicobacter sp. 13S00477-4]